jgi:DegV family protein with EDD domain
MGKENTSHSAVRITADSICDLPKDFIEKHNIALMPLIINLGDTAVEDGNDIAEQIYTFADKTHQTPKTAARSAEEYAEFFIKHKPEKGALIHFNISAELSASHQNALNGGKDIPNIFIVDSRLISTGTGLLIMYAVELAEKGMDAAEIVKMVTARIPEVQCSFLTKSLTYLHRGGRCSGLSRFLATTMAIRPQIMNTDGKLVPGKKYMGIYNLCLKKYVNDILCSFNNPDLNYCFVTHTKMDNPKIAEEIINQIRAKYDFKHILETTASGTITSHCGPNTLGVLYINKKGKV